MKQRVVDHIVGHLAAIGVDYIFGVDGANIEDLYDAAFFQSDITAVLAKHEFSAATMADGYSRSGGGLGVVAANSGVSALNLVAGLGESFTSRVPVLALVGQPETTMDGRGSLQDTSGRNGSLNAEALFSEVSVFCRRVQTPADIASALPAAVAAARTGGPAVLLLPKDVQQSDVRVNGCVGEHGVERPGNVGDPRPIVRALRRVTGPVTIIAGEQVARDDARAELASLRAVLRARVACVPHAKDAAGAPAFDGPGVRYRDAMSVLDRVLPDGVDIVVDVGSTGAAAVHYLPVRRGGRFAVALGMGYSFGAGIGMAFGRAKARTPGGRVVVIAGDGAFFMHGMEVHTAVHYRLPVTFVLFNNNAHAMGVIREQLFYGDRHSYNRFAPSRLGAGLAAMLPGLPSVDVNDADGFSAAMRTALDVDGPSVVSIECAADEIPPFATFLEPSVAKNLVCQDITQENRTDVALSV
jgi:thiamine pyrophosphate-dependent acetolactate synthase large subunit-like protein